MAEALVGSADHGFLDRLLHRVAFAHPALQRVLGDVEDDLFRARLEAVRIERPVLVTGLPRAGTTLVLELLHGTGEFATFTYRQMPFVLNPLLWQRLGGGGTRRAAPRRERAHGDGVRVGLDSPEAFEEVLWITHLGERLFADGAMRPLGAEDLGGSFPRAWRQLAAKLVCLHGGETRSGRPLRYLSKNNANLSRLPALLSVFDDAVPLVCFRDPASHVASLHSQHLRFSALHARDRFAERYMGWIGHHDFGANFRPILFDRPIAEPPDERAFWLRYWIDAYRYVLATLPERARLVRFEALLEGGREGLERLAAVVGLERPATLVAAADGLRAPTSAALALEEVSEPLAAEARALYGSLSARAAF